MSRKNEGESNSEYGSFMDHWAQEEIEAHTDEDANCLKILERKENIIKVKNHVFPPGL